MRVLVTGAEGFIGSALVSAASASDEIRATDRADGDIADPDHVAACSPRRSTASSTSPAIPSGATEADFAAGRRVNVDATTLLLRHCRAQVDRGGPVPRFVYASSIAVFGMPLPARIDDATVPAPSLAYGMQKRDQRAARRRRHPARRPRRPLAAPLGRRRPAARRRTAPSPAFNSDLIREPLAGRDYVCPVGPDATIWITSLRTAVDNLLRLAEVDGAALGARARLDGADARPLVADIVAALGRFDPAAPARVRYLPQAADRSAVRALAARLRLRARRSARPSPRRVDRRARPLILWNRPPHDHARRRSSARPSSRKASTARRTAPSCARRASTTRTSASRSSASSASTARTRRARCRSARRPTPRGSASPRPAASPCAFTTISVSDGVSMNHRGMRMSLVSRELIADSIEAVMRGARLRRAGRLRRLRQDAARRDDGDGAAQLPERLRLRRRDAARPAGAASDVTILTTYEGVGSVLAGTMTEAELDELEPRLRADARLLPRPVHRQHDGDGVGDARPGAARLGDAAGGLLRAAGAGAPRRPARRRAILRDGGPLPRDLVTRKSARERLPPRSPPPAARPTPACTCRRSRTRPASASRSTTSPRCSRARR